MQREKGHRVLCIIIILAAALLGGHKKKVLVRAGALGVLQHHAIAPPAVPRALQAVVARLRALVHGAVIQKEGLGRAHPLLHLHTRNNNHATSYASQSSLAALLTAAFGSLFGRLSQAKELFPAATSTPAATATPGTTATNLCTTNWGGGWRGSLRGVLFLVRHFRTRA